MALLTIEELTVEYQTDGAPVRAVDRMSLTVGAGEVVALVGESGCGKTSVALALTKLLPARSAIIAGRVSFEGRNLLELDQTSLQAIRGGRIAYVFQDPATSLNPVMTIGAQLVEAIELHTGARGRNAQATAVEWLQHVGIPSAAERFSAYPHECSGGMQQRACLAMALAARPQVLIADEPTTALDVTVQVHILRLLRQLQRELGLALLLISHDVTVVERIAHRVGVMSTGRLVESGSVEQVLYHPRHSYTQELLRYRSMMSLPPRSGHA